MLRERLNKDLLIFDGGLVHNFKELGMKAGEIQNIIILDI